MNTPTDRLLTVVEMRDLFYSVLRVNPFGKDEFVADILVLRLVNAEAEKALKHRKG